ncbi:YhgE/Pip domain-containing protein [Peribacillus saganii]|uniref:YhgE/Pip domain-containing protein n=1 Tax=Peribacillus saganii TaxID=2303992 RepID=A0A372LD15_9BACI|nr:YhgE/Pip domain-containing protein [Peribacillus saganii]RFU63558.1 YhgE/Pip domain-containing protein [Peribacillus saganii]
MGGKLLIQELKAILSNRKLLIPILAVLFIPILYSGMFLWAFWDPYKHLDQLPVAIVNGDKGAEMDGEAIELGNDFVKKLKESDEFDFHFVQKDEGYKKLKDQDYYLLVEIPESFSRNATTLLNENPEKLELKYVPNESYNFLSSQIGETAVARIKVSLSEKVTETYAETMFDSISKMTDGFTAASKNAEILNSGIDEVNSGAKTLQEKLSMLAEKQLEFRSGAVKVQSGSTKLTSGTKELAEGLVKLSEGQRQLLDGAKKAEAGSEALVTGMLQVHQGTEAANQASSQIVNGTAQIHQGAVKLSDNLNSFKEGAANTSNGASQLQSGVAELQTMLGPLLASLPADKQAELTAAFGKINAGSGEVASATAKLSQSAGQLSSGAGQLAVKLDELNNGQTKLQQSLEKLSKAGGELQSGSQQLQAGQTEMTAGISQVSAKLSEAKEGAGKLAGGAESLSNGITQLEDGTAALADGAGQLADGSSKITSGTSKLAEGSKEFKEKLDDAKEKASGVKADDKTFNMMASPVKVEKDVINHVPNYGTGFAPYFLSLGLFVGALMLSIVYPLREPAVTPKNGFSWFIGKFGVLAGAGIIQALIASAILLWGLGIKVQNVPLFMLFAIITSLVFITLIQFFVTSLGDPGRFAAIIILILQLTTSAGTFPLELIPAQLQVFNSFLPMTYSVQGFKEVISSGNFVFMWENAYVLLGFTAVFIAGTIGYFSFKYKRSYSAFSSKGKENV